MNNAMKLGFLLVSFFVGVSVAARRTRSTTAATVTTPTVASIEELSYADQTEELEHPWDSIKLQKIDGRSNSWSNNQNTSNDTIETIGRDNSSIIEGKQYGEIPNPILPTYVPLPYPPLPPGCLAPRGQFPSPRSCANYLNCWDDVVIEQTCPNGLLFNDYTNFCDFPYNVNCGTRPLPTPKPPLPPGSKICPEPYGRYRSSTNCSEFYVCVAGKPIKFACPRGLVYNDELNVCDYLRNVDCKGAATPKPYSLTTQSWSELPVSTQYPSYPSQSPYATQQPSYIPQQPTIPGSLYLENGWGNKVDQDAWQQRTSNQENVQKEEEKDAASSEPETLQELPESSSITNPWTIIHTIPASISKVPCADGDLHKLDEACTSVIVCRAGRPQLVRCSTGQTYDRPSDSCQPFSIAKC
ncbi:hypothetical protein KPH14_006725 [Odynerus spinipes]|uniref:Chitin-binding type-2 domain-containing protein n=1 Tax=Odynerus spinipes TaxID=1348599 RepID=A0AAD9RR02_9HYME|nr:hypothetical protein KPH14_006725 [Odynerus spinipes]